MQKHAQQTKLHQAAIEQRCERDGIQRTHGPPSVQHFKQVLEAGSTTKGLPGIGERKKVRKMQWCIAEARRNLNKAFWLRCKSMSISQDKRSTRLLIRWRAATPELEMRSGVLGLLRDVPDVFEGIIGSDSTLASTTFALLQACTTTAPPYLSGLPEPPVDCELYEHLQDIIEVFAADAASDEQLVGRELSHKFKAPNDDVPPVLPNLVMVARDATHASKRSLARPWATDDYLASVMNMFIEGDKAICKLIQFSPVIGQWFHTAIQRMDLPLTVSDAIKDLSWAKQRYDGVARPLGRAVTFSVAQP